MSFHCLDASYRLIRELETPLERVRSFDRKLYVQLRTAAVSIPLNVAEGRGRAGQDRRHLWRIAHGSAEEVRAALKVAEAFGELEPQQLMPVYKTLDRLLAMLWAMTH